MPSRRRPKSPAHSSASAAVSPTARALTDVERFAAAIKASEQADRASKARQLQERNDAVQRAELAASQAAALADARRELERAVDAVRTAKQVGRGRAEADERWRFSKALVIELETGTRPAWAPKLPVPPVGEDVDATAADGSDVAEGIEVGGHDNEPAAEVASDTD